MTGSRVDVSTLQQALDTVFDQALVYHAYTDYMRDYEMILYLTADPVTGVAPIYLRYLFRYCVEVRTCTSVRRDVWRESLDDRLLGDPGTIDQDGYVWGVKSTLRQVGEFTWPGLSNGPRRWPPPRSRRRRRVSPVLRARRCRGGGRTPPSPLRSCPRA
ncbi:hypothetical protein [Microbispora catharanthi]|uniref:YxiG-like protein n=1 Tax=Microbispora catharanthi TaxID=1712871 RepID=UPI003B831134